MKVILEEEEKGNEEKKASGKTIVFGLYKRDGRVYTYLQQAGLTYRRFSIFHNFKYRILQNDYQCT